MMNEVQKRCCASILTSCSKIGTSVLALYFFRWRVGECRHFSQNINTCSLKKQCYSADMKKINVRMEALLFQKHQAFSTFFAWMDDLYLLLVQGTELGQEVAKTRPKRVVLVVWKKIVLFRSTITLAIFAAPGLWTSMWECRAFTLKVFFKILHQS